MTDEAKKPKRAQDEFPDQFDDYDFREDGEKPDKDRDEFVDEMVAEIEAELAQLDARKLDVKMRVEKKG